MFTCRKQKDALDEIEKVFSSFGNYPKIEYEKVELVPSTRRIVICTETPNKELRRKIRKKWENKEIETNTYKGSVNCEIKEKKLKIYIPDFEISLNDPLIDIERNEVIQIVFRTIDKQLFSENFWHNPLTNYTIFITNDELFKEGTFATIMDCLNQEVNIKYGYQLFNNKTKSFSGPFYNLNFQFINIHTREQLKQPFSEKSYI